MKKTHIIYMMHKILLFTFFILAGNVLYAQKQANNWVFGYNVILTWNTLQDFNAKRLDNGAVVTLKRIPTALPNLKMGSSTNYFISNGTSFALSDKDGKIQIFSDAKDVWSSNFSKSLSLPNMYLGTPSGGTLMPIAGSSTDYIAVVPVNGSTGVNVFKLRIDPAWGNISIIGSPVNLKQYITSYVLYNDVSQAAAMILKPDKKSMWVVVPGMPQGNKPSLYSVTLNAAGNTEGAPIQNALPTSPASFPNMNISTSFATGQIKISPDSKYILWGMGIGYVLLGEFNIETGEVFSVKYFSSSATGIEFSRNGKFLYLVSGRNTSVYSAAELLSAANPNSVSPVYTYTVPALQNYTCYLQLAPDGRIYQTVASAGGNIAARNMLVINQPDKADIDPEVYLLENILLEGTYTSGGLCNFSGSWFSNDIDGPNEVCALAQETYSYTYASGTTTDPVAYTIWNFGDGTPAKRVDISGPSSGSGVVTCSHIYTSPKTYAITVTSYTSANTILSTTMEHSVTANLCVAKVNPHIRITAK